MEIYDSNIKQAISELEQVRSTTETLVPQFIGIVAQFVTSWSQRIVERAIAEKPDVTMSLGKEKLGQMKECFQAILQAVPARAEKRLNDNILWPHRTDMPKGKESDAMSAYELNKLHVDQLDEALRELIGDVGGLLIEYGFSNASGQTEWEKKSGKLRYKYGISDYDNPHSSGKKQLNEQYKQAIDRYVVATKKLKDAERSKASAEAKNLWANA